MKYFDKDYIEGNISNEEAYNRESLYKKELDNTIKEVNENIKDFITTVSLRDSILQKVEQKQNDLCVTILYGDCIAGHYSMEILLKDGKVNYINQEKVPFEVMQYEYSYDSLCHCSFINEYGDELNFSFTDIVICKTEMHNW